MALDGKPSLKRPPLQMSLLCNGGGWKRLQSIIGREDSCRFQPHAFDEIHPTIGIGEFAPAALPVRIQKSHERHSTTPLHRSGSRKIIEIANAVDGMKMLLSDSEVRRRTLGSFRLTLRLNLEEEVPAFLPGKLISFLLFGNTILLEQLLEEHCVHV
jgi:hypothetical protein